MSLQIRDGKPGLFYDCAPDKDSEFWEIENMRKTVDDSNCEQEWKHEVRLKDYGWVIVCPSTYEALKALKA